METTVLEAPDDLKDSNVEAAKVAQVENKVEDAAEVQKTEENSSVGSEETQKEAQKKSEKSDETVEKTVEETVELDGEKVPLSQLKKWKEDYTNDSKWKQRNQLESEAVKKDRQRLARLEILEPILEQRPEILQQIFQPQVKSKDLQTELQEHYAKRPVAGEDGTFDINAYNRWEIEKDLLISKASTQRFDSERQERTKAEVQEHSSRLEAKWTDEYVKTGKLTQDEFIQTLGWIVNNIQARGGKIPEEAMDIAYASVHRDKFLREAKLEATKKTIAPIVKAKSSTETDGSKPQDVEKSDADLEDDSFTKTVRMSTKNYMRLP